jgi:hypothetical protein
MPLACHLNAQNPRPGDGRPLTGWLLDLKKKASHATDGMPAGLAYAFDFKGSEFACDLGHTLRHTINNEIA